MSQLKDHIASDPLHARRRLGLGAAVAAAVLLAACPALAQGWWPWSAPETEDRPPIPDEPVYGQPQYEPPPPQGPPPANWSTKNPICLQLEQRLVQDSQRTGQSRQMLPQLEAEIRQVNHDYESSENELERRNCYDYFLFSKTLRRTRQCVDLDRQREHAKRRLRELEAQRQQIIGSSERSYREEIISELARNNCGSNYVQEARRQNRGVFDSIWQDEEGGNYSNNWTPYGAPSYSTYRTVCVRLCDGYYFPVSFSTLPSHFQQDANVCQSKCAAPVELYYYQNPGATVDQSVALGTQEPYTSLKTAFRYRKQLVPGCSCKQTEFVPQSTPGDAAQIQGDAATGWEARSDWEAKERSR
jgi:Protein of unknown function (DUF2865)